MGANVEKKSAEVAEEKSAIDDGLGFDEVAGFGFGFDKDDGFGFDKDGGVDFDVEAESALDEADLRTEGSEGTEGSGKRGGVDEETGLNPGLVEHGRYHIA